ncbi:heparinase II/III family protein [Planctomycetota bacterium]
MKTPLLTFCLIGLAWIPAAKCSNYDSYTGFTCNAVPSLPQVELHPSLWFKEADVTRLRALKNQDKIAADLWKQITKSPFLTMPFPPVPSKTDDTKTIHQYYGTMSQIAKYAGFMIWMTEDPNARAPWIARTSGALERAYDGPIKKLDPVIKSSPVDEIYMGTWLQNYAAAYDWVQPFLTAPQDKQIRARLAEENNRVAINLHNWARDPHNHLSKPAWGVGSMALALSDEPRAAGWLQKALAATNDNLRYFFSADGIYREGSHYMIFSWINFVPFMFHYYNVSGVNQFKDYKPLMEWGVAVRNGKGWLPNIEDSYLRPFPGHMTARMYQNEPTRLHASAPLAEVMTWGYKTTEMGLFDRYFEETGFNYSGATWDYSLALDEYLTYDPTIASTPPDCSPTVFLKGGQSLFRNTWASSDPSMRYLLFQGVAEADNHHHTDHLSFILFAENQMMASDAGYTRGSYRDASRTSWYNKAVAHNVITLDGKAPVDAAENVTPVSKYRMDTSFFDFEEKVAPYPNDGQLRRAIAFPGESYFVVADIVTSPVSAPAVLHLHGGRGTMTGKGNFRVWQFAEDTYGPAAQLQTWTLGADSIENDQGESTYLKSDFGSFPYIKAKASGKEMVFLQVLFPAKPGEAAPEVVSIKQENRIWATVSSKDLSDTLMIQAGREETIFQDVETDGTFCWVRAKAGKTTYAAVREATYLRKEGQVLFEAADPHSGTVDLEQGNRGCVTIE